MRDEAVTWIASAIVGLAGLLTLVGMADTPPAARYSPAPSMAVQVDPYRWHDADTAQGTLRLPYGVSLDADRGIRALGYDAWEIGARGGANVTDAERQRGQAAVAELRALSAGRTLWAAPAGRGERDSFGRPLAAFWLRDDAGWIDVAQWARERGHVRR